MSFREWNTLARPAGESIGTHIPFTAPLLAGVCGRIQDRTLDFILPNPSGRRGTYVANWTIATEYAAPTLHDTMLARRLRELPALDPVVVREAAREVAIEGYAGRKAAEAALRTKGMLEKETRHFWSQMLAALIRAYGIPADRHVHILARLDAAGAEVMNEELSALSTHLGWEPARLSEALDRLSAAYAPLCPAGRVPALLAYFEQLQVELSEELAHQVAASGQAPPRLRRTATRVERCLNQSRRVAARASRHLAEPEALLDQWRSDPAAALLPMRALERTLDGWDRICLLWLDRTSRSARLSALSEISLLVGLADGRTVTDPAMDDEDPMQPAAEAAEPLPLGSLAGAAEILGANPGPFMIERYERIRTCELALENGNG